jgi:hypothetical protein
MTKRFLVVLVLSILCLTSMASAEEKKIGNMTIDELKKELGMGLYLQGSYLYNFKNSATQENELRVFDHKANSFTLDLAQLVLTKDAPMKGAGYKFKLSAGETAKWIHSRGLGASDDSFDLTEAYISYLADVGTGLRFDFGKMVTYHGAEVIEAKDNPNYSRSLLFNYAIPFTHTGLKVSYKFSDALNAGIYVVNGWDNTDDNNKGKTLGLSVGVTPVEQISMLFNFMYGPEKDNNTKDNRSLFDWVGTIKPVKNLSLILNVDYAKEENTGADDSKWYGYAGIVKYEFSDFFSTALRAEYFNDKNGVRTGTVQKVKEITLTPEFKLAKDLLLRPEYRHDWSDVSVFDSGAEKTQDTFSVGIMYSW